MQNFHDSKGPTREVFRPLNLIAYWRSPVPAHTFVEAVSKNKWNTMKENRGTLVSTVLADIVMIAIIALVVFTVIHAMGQQQAGNKRTDLQRQDLSVPGHEVVQVRVDFNPGYMAPKHTHPGEEIIYVIEGTLQYQIGEKTPVTVKRGDVLFVPAGTTHSAKNIGTGNGAELATYIVEKGEPLITMIK